MRLKLLCACAAAAWMVACSTTRVAPPKTRPPKTQAPKTQAPKTPASKTQAPKTQGPQEEGVRPVHEVLKGETLYGIAKQHRVPLPELLAANGLKATDTLHIGQRLWIPRALAAAETKSAQPTSAAFFLRWPVKGMLYAKFGKKGREVHDGVDLAAPQGTEVRAAAAGKVLYAGEQKGYGKIVIIEHEAGLITLYAHNHTLRTQTGALVSAETIISTVGQSGRTSGPHLHFELRKNGIPVDPLPYFKPARP